MSLTLLREPTTPVRLVPHAVAVPALTDASWISKLLGFVALILASVTIFGGFLVTSRMLAMYKKKAK